MANICDNQLTFYSDDKDNVEVFEKFFEKWEDSDINRVSDDNIECYFPSRWTFPQKEMDELYNSMPNKQDLYMRCLSVEFGNLYHSLNVCEENGWYEV